MRRSYLPYARSQGCSFDAKPRYRHSHPGNPQNSKDEAVLNATLSLSLHDSLVVNVADELIERYKQDGKLTPSQTLYPLRENVSSGGLTR
jgi:hypothetical protein